MKSSACSPRIIANDMQKIKYAALIIRFHMRSSESSGTIWVLVGVRATLNVGPCLVADTILTTVEPAGAVNAALCLSGVNVVI